MTPQKLKPETLQNLKETPVGHQYNQFVRVTPKDAITFFNAGKKVLILVGNDGYWAESPDEMKQGKKFVCWR